MELAGNRPDLCTVPASRGRVDIVQWYRFDFEALCGHIIIQQLYSRTSAIPVRPHLESLNANPA